MDRLGLDLMSAFGLPPVEYVGLAADLGCGHVTTGLTGLPWRLSHFPAWSLRDDLALRRETTAALRDRGVAISVVSGFSLRPQADVRDFAADIDLAAELGARQVGSVGMDPDIPRAHDQLATLTEMAAARGLQVVFDYAPHQAINDLTGALAALRHTGSPNALLSLDAMHVFRAGGTLADVAALDPALIGYAQVCDAPRAAPHPDYAREVTFERLVPGDGELPLAAFVAALPRDVLIGVEVPNLAAVEADGLNAFMTRAVAASRALLPESVG
ncbi:sugar phosphate isomerase/epimerase [Phenylobacterium sp. LjRoot219]|uniref:sugar phosphate isomerase/epimerase family protein n=1 Tax=Phenylobacterium sp. LjRoot219 TaxID=3342283 RepID=UPI003ECE46B0